MKSNKRFLVIVALVLALALSLVACGGGVQPPTKAPAGTDGAPEQTTKAFTVTVVHADGSSKDFSYDTDEKYVGAVLQAEGLIEGDDGQYGLYIKIVDGEKAVYEENGAYWAFYVNGEYALKGIDQTPIENGAVYKLEYTKG